MEFFNFSLGAVKLGTVQNPGWDALLLICFFGAVILTSFFANRERLALVLLSVYTALALTLATPVIGYLLLYVKKTELLSYRLGIFIVFFLVLYILFSHKFSIRPTIGRSWFQGLIISILQVGLFMSSALSFIPKSVFSSVVSTTFFTGEVAFSLWLLAPLVVIFFMPHSD